MSQVEPASTTNPSIELTRKGERFAAQEAARLDAIATKNAFRREVAAEVERLLDILDRLDGDPGLEDGADDEPSLGFTRPGAGSSYDPGDDRELDTADDEPSLGAPEAVTTGFIPPAECLPAYWRSPAGRQTHWAKGGGDDLEDARG